MLHLKSKIPWRKNFEIVDVSVSLRVIKMLSGHIKGFLTHSFTILTVPWRKRCKTVYSSVNLNLIKLLSGL